MEGNIDMSDWEKIDFWKYAESKVGFDNRRPLNNDQMFSVKALDHQLKSHGAIIADEVGTGKTRIACALIDYICNKQKGRVAVLIPPGLIRQWQKEYALFSNEKPIIIRNFRDLCDNYDKIIKNNSHSNLPVFISQNFCYPIIKDGAPEWKYALPAIAIYQKYKDMSFSDYPHFGCKNAKRFIRDNTEGDNTDEMIIHWAEFLANSDLFKYKKMDAFNNFDYWKPINFHTDGTGRCFMTEKIIPRMFGHVDLVIMDEAHKSEGDESRVNKIFEMLKNENSKPRIVGMTATPIELDPSQWINILERIDVDTESEKIERIITEYCEALKQLELIQDENDEAIETLKDKSKKFEDVIGEYVTRRKRIIDDSGKFIKKINVSEDKINPHHKNDPRNIKLSDIEATEKNNLFYQEGLSESLRDLQSEGIQRLKNLHYMYSRGYVPDNAYSEAKEVIQEASKNDENKNQCKRVEFWLNKLAEQQQPIFKHPKIRKAIDVIEEKTKNGAKVLVFGFYTSLITTISDCINARYILNNINAGKLARVPGKFLANDSVEILKYEVSNLQHEFSDFKLNFENLQDSLRKARSRYETFRPKIKHFVDTKEKELMKKFYNDNINCDETEHLENIVKILVARLADEIMFSNNDIDLTKIEQKIVNDKCKPIFNQLVGELYDDVFGAIEIENLNADDDEAKTEALDNFFYDQQNLTGSEYAMLFSGDVSFERRAIVQTEFNRRNGFPRVLVAQTTVGKEGLNLHKSCRTIVFLNADWNPGVIEQQIGRVDRIASLWEEDKNIFIKDEKNTMADAPYIELISVEFDGTYDMSQWTTLRARQKTLRHQLYGSLPEGTTSFNSNWSENIEKRIKEVLPDLTPQKYLERNNL